MTTIQDREYVRKDKNRLIPEDKGRLVTAVLQNYFRKYVGYDFTADLENQLDEVSAGEADYKKVLERFWRDFSAAIAETGSVILRDTETSSRLGALAPCDPPHAEDAPHRVSPSWPRSRPPSS